MNKFETILSLILNAFFAATFTVAATGCAYSATLTELPTRICFYVVLSVLFGVLSYLTITEFYKDIKEYRHERDKKE
ncbi:MAG: hypothetical protein LBQ64_05810 [Bacteroidales bacterium]|jgi:peptidoglycan biosynthesis protein MviN/MurJ (putative lipid II flippase)|nr:hypothetical protein [Bacteroidales bacterium]